MANNKRPLIKFEQRYQDAGNTRGGGNSFVPKWTLTGTDLEKRSQTLVTELDNIGDTWNDTNFGHLPHILNVQLSDDAKSKTHQKQIIPLFIVGENTGQTGFHGEDALLMKVDKKEKLEKIKQNFENLQKNAVQISAVTSLESYTPVLKSYDANHPYKLNPLTYDDEKLNEQAIKIILENLKSANIDSEVLHYNQHQTIIKIPEMTNDSLKFVRTLPIKSGEPLEKASFPFRSRDVSPIDPDLIFPYDSSAVYPTVGLLDSGVSINNLTTGWVTRGDGCQYDDSELETSHGTYIATLLIYGDVLANTTDSAIKGCNIIDVPIAPRGGIDGPELIENIRTAISSNKSVKVWNLSVSLTGEISENKFSDFAIALDDLQKEFDVIICKSAGNDPEFCEKGCAGKLSIGAESMRSIVVGSLNRHSDNFGFTKQYYPAAYSRRGPGPASIIKPDVVHFGGDLNAITNAPSTINDFEPVSDTSSADGINFIHRVGTSFSTPKVAKTIAELLLLTENKYSLQTVKALMVQSARYKEVPSLDNDSRLEALGYGLPKRADEELYDSEFNSTLILEGSLAKGKNINIMDFPYPNVLVKNHKYTGKIKVTLVYDPLLVPDFDSEYCQSNLEIRFGTYDQKVDANPKQKTFNPLTTTDNFNTLNTSNFSRRSIKSHTEYATERTLIRYGKKYHAVKKFVFDLSELTPSKLDKMSDNRHWFLFLEGHYRNFAESKAQENFQKLEIPFSLIITIEDPDKSVDVYDSTVKALDDNYFVHSNISVDNNIHLNN